MEPHPDCGLANPEYFGDLAEGVALLDQRDHLDLLGGQEREDFLPALARDDVIDRRAILRGVEFFLMRAVAGFVPLPGAVVVLGSIDARALEGAQKVLLEVRPHDGELRCGPERNFLNDVGGFHSTVEEKSRLQQLLDLGVIRLELKCQRWFFHVPSLSGQSVRVHLSCAQGTGIHPRLRRGGNGEQVNP